MSGFWRYTLLAFFGAVGIALALCLGLSSTTPGSPAADSIANASATSALNAVKSRPASVIHVAGPVVEQVKPPIAQLAPADGAPHASSSAVPPPLVNPQAAVAATTQPEVQLAQDDMMQQLRKELEKAVQKQNDASGSAPPAADNGQNANSNRGRSAPPARLDPTARDRSRRRSPSSNLKSCGSPAKETTILRFTSRIPTYATCWSCSASRAA